MRVSHEQTAPVTPLRALDGLQAFLAGRRSSKEPCTDMECFERELHEYVVATEREVLAEEMARLDVDLPVVTIEGELYRQVVRCEESYVSAAGPVRVMRSLYRRGGEGERTVCPLELRAGMVEERWTPLAARQAAFVVAHLTPQEGEDLFRELGNMTPSKSSLDRLPKQLSRCWEAERERFEAALRGEETVPPEGGHGGRFPRWSDGPDEGRGARTKAPGRQGPRQAHPRSGGLPRGGLWDVEFL